MIQRGIEIEERLSKTTPGPWITVAEQFYTFEEVEA